MEMLKSISKQHSFAMDGFAPVLSSEEFFADLDKEEEEEEEEEEQGNDGDGEIKFKPQSNEEMEEGFLARMGTLFCNSLSTKGEDDASGSMHGSLPSNQDGYISDEHISDLKGRYYYEKFNFSPLDAEKHIALQKSYIEGLVWNLQYYYKGCASWDWFYPYHYGKSNACIPTTTKCAA